MPPEGLEIRFREKREGEPMVHLKKRSGPRYFRHGLGALNNAQIEQSHIPPTQGEPTLSPCLQDPCPEAKNQKSKGKRLKTGSQ